MRLLVRRSTWPSPPFFNVVIVSSGGGISLQQIEWFGGGFLDQLMIVNLLLVAFNLIPAFPMDGGRVLRALLARKLEFAKATQISARVGQGIAVLFAIAGLFSDPFLIFIALFVWMGAQQEASMASRVHVSVGDIPVQHIMLQDFHTLRPDDKLGDAVGHVLAGWREDFPVVFGDHVLGMLTRESMTRSLSQSGPDTLVRDAMRRDVPTVEPRLRLEQALVLLRESNCRSLPVEHEGRIVGLLTLDNVGEFLSIHSALRQAGRNTRDKEVKDAARPSSDTII